MGAIGGIDLICPEHRSALKMDISLGRYLCEAGCEFPIIKGIPRFVAKEGYWSSFGLQWNEFSKTQLDSFTGTRISRDRLTRVVGGSLDVLKGKRILEAGCGAGRFTEIMLDVGAHVFAVDISTAVEANVANCAEAENYFVCQADVLKLPFSVGQFDVVVCVGVVQHTPNPEKTIRSLCSHVRPGGLLVMDHYSKEYPLSLSRKALRSFLLKKPKQDRIAFCISAVEVLWPIHRLLWRLRGVIGMKRIRNCFLRCSPLVDYHDAYPELGPRFLRDWAILDTHDTLTDEYKHLRSEEEIAGHLKQCRMIDIEVAYGGNGVEARARKAADG
jgi:SAM-dependent methyltransferase